MAAVPTPTPEERETRIAELRARRRARVRKLALRSAVGIGALGIVVVFALYWLLTTLGGREFLLSQIVARLPAGVSLTWQEAQGPASGPLTLTGVRYVQRSCPDKDGKPVPFGQCVKPETLVFTARRIVLDPDIRPLFGKLLRLDRLDVNDATLELSKNDKPFELPRWPQVLPKIELPLDLQADTVRIDSFKVAQAGKPIVDVRTLRGGLDARDGSLHLEHLVVDSDRGHFVAHGDYNPRNDYATDLTLSALLPAPAGRTRPRLGLAARGDLSQMEVALSGNAPGPLRLRLSLRGRGHPRWTLKANSPALDPGLLAGSGVLGTPLAFDLIANGIGGEATVHGTLTRAEFVAVLQPSRLRVEDQVLELKPLVVDLYGGRITARGRGDFKVPTQARFKFSVTAHNLVLGGAAGGIPANDAAPAVGADADFGIAGTTNAWAAIGKATLTREDQRASIDFDGRGNAEQLALKTLHVAMPTGSMDAGGLVGWTPSLHWNIDAALAGFDPGYFAHDWPGAINGRFTSTGSTRDDGGLEAEVDADKLGGTLRGRKLGGHAAFAMHGAAPLPPPQSPPATGSRSTRPARTDYEGNIALTLGGSRIDAKGKVTDTLDIDAKLSPLQLADLFPGTAGMVRGTLALSGHRDAPNIDANLDGSGLKYGAYSAASFSAKGRLPWKGSGGSLVIAARDLNAGVALSSLRVDAQGAMETLQLDAAARGEIGALDLSGRLERRGGNWRGVLSTLQLAPLKGAHWQLQAPARFAQAGAGWTLSDSCFASGAGGTLCASADWPRRGLAVRSRALPLSLLEPYLPKRKDGGAWALGGEIALDALLRPAGNAYAGHIRLTSASGGLRTRKQARRDAIAYENLAFDANFDPRHIQATLASAFNGNGRIDARVHTGWDAYAPLSGEIAINTDQLTWMELFSPDIVNPTGTLEGHITLDGARAQPAFGGHAQLRAFTTELPALGIVVQHGELRLDARNDGNANLAGSLDSGAGTLKIDGSLGWRAPVAGQAAAPLRLHVHGDNVLVSDTRDLHAIASPDVTVRYAATQPISVTGKVLVPEATLDLERLDEGVSTSSDVVVLDPVHSDRRADTTPLALDLSLVMGDAVLLHGFGLDGNLKGELRVRSVPGRDMSALGVLEIGGTYKAYGQELAITRGRLQWSNGPVDDPILDIRAERKLKTEDITAGIDVHGRASSPQAEVWTDPATSQSDALSYLALGRATSNLSSAEGRQLNAASAALSAGGNLLASQLGGKIGLSNAGVSESRALGGSVLGIGKQLSPRLYVGFGVSLLGTGQVLTLKYLLRKGFDVEIESSTLENRGSINWRKEK